MKLSKKLHYAWFILLAVSLIRGFAGPVLNGSSGLFLTPVSQELGIGIGQLSIYLSISAIVTLFWLPFAGGKFEKVPVKTLAVAGALLQALSVAALGFMNVVWGWYLLAIPWAMGGVVLVNLLGPVLINRWFASNQGLVIGVMMTITSLLGALFQPLLTGLMAGLGWRLSYQIIGLSALFCILLVVFLLLKNRPQDMGLPPYSSQRASKKKEGDPLTGVTVKQALKSPSFYLLVLFMMVLTGFASFSQHITTFGLGEGYELTRIGSALSLSMVGAAIGAVVIGFASDRFGAVPVGIGDLILGTVSILLFLMSGQSFLLFAIACFLFGLSTSSIGVMAPVLTTTFFGNREYEKLYSLVMLGAPLASILLLPGYGFVYDTFQSYQLVFYFLLGSLALGAVCLLIGRKSSRRLMDKK